MKYNNRLKFTTIFLIYVVLELSLRIQCNVESSVSDLINTKFTYQNYLNFLKPFRTTTSLNVMNFSHFKSTIKVNSFKLTQSSKENSTKTKSRNTTPFDVKNVGAAIQTQHEDTTRRHIKRSHNSITCFSCASEEYETLYSRSDNLFSFGQPLQFDKSCDSQLSLESFAPTIRCDSMCISVLEPQYFGGILNKKRPYSYVRGCAIDIFAVSNAAAIAAAIENKNDYETPHFRMALAKIELLHRAELCVFLPIRELWPELFPKTENKYSLNRVGMPELVKVCSCRKNGCNTHDALNSGVSDNCNFVVFHFLRYCLTFLLILKFV